MATLITDAVNTADISGSATAYTFTAFYKIILLIGALPLPEQNPVGVAVASPVVKSIIVQYIQLALKPPAGSNSNSGKNNQLWL